MAVDMVRVKEMCLAMFCRRSIGEEEEVEVMVCEIINLFSCSDDTGTAVLVT